MKTASAFLIAAVLAASPARALDDAIPARLAALLNCDQRLDLLGYAYAGCVDEAELVREAGYKVELTRNEDVLRPAMLDEFVASAEFTIDEIDRRLRACRQTETQRFMVVLDCRARVALPKALMLREIAAGRGIRKPRRR